MKCKLLCRRKRVARSRPARLLQRGEASPRHQQLLRARESRRRRKETPHSAEQVNPPRLALLRRQRQNHQARQVDLPYEAQPPQGNPPFRRRRSRQHLVQPAGRAAARRLPKARQLRSLLLPPRRHLERGRPSRDRGGQKPVRRRWQVDKARDHPAQRPRVAKRGGLLPASLPCLHQPPPRQHLQPAKRKRSSYLDKEAALRRGAEAKSKAALSHLSHRLRSLQSRHLKSPQRSRFMKQSRRSSNRRSRRRNQNNSCSNSSMRCTSSKFITIMLSISTCRPSSRC
mmetsp:Transcript_34324/g.80305  ORF Transcript_34324/g.80305 Transcript_34324/m.80305 type:complete len:285 (+) Transcript_34324:2997-3851(+)